MTDDRHPFAPVGGIARTPQRDACGDSAAIQALSHPGTARAHACGRDRPDRAFARGIVCFIEVKARADDRTAMESVGPRQHARIERAASLYVAGKPDLARKGVRFDIVTVTPFPRHIPDAWRP